MRTERDPERPLVSDRTVLRRVATDQTTITFSLTSADHAELVALLDEGGARKTASDMCTAFTARSGSGDIRMPAAYAEEFLQWLRSRARAGRTSSATVELERGLLLGRVALAVQRALAKLSSVA